jgi:4-amino-4-deoxy-L-arabinose transferase-like glycosyltransferase
VALALAAALAAGFALRLRTGRDWALLGSDSYAYMGAAQELWQHHRYAFPPAPWQRTPGEQTPPGYGRLPAYPLFLAAVTRPEIDRYDAMLGPAKTAQALLDLGTGLLVFFIARRLAGRWAAALALALALVHPGLVLFSNAILSETLATFLTTLTVALVVAALGPEIAPRRARWALILAGAAAALATLTRIDCVLVGAIFLVPLGARRPRAPRQTVAWAALAFLVCFAPWPARNLITLGRAHPFGGPCDIRGREMPYTAFFGWFATWLEREDQTPETLYCLLKPRCAATVATYPALAFDSPEERTRLARLFELRRRGGFTAEIDEGFRALTRERMRRHPLRSFVTLPAVRAWHLWVNRNDQPLRATVQRPWPAVIGKLEPGLLVINVALLVLGLAGLALAVVRGPAGARAVALALALALAGRTAFFAFIGFVDARYMLEVTPSLLALAGVPLAMAVAAVRRGGPTASSP